MVSIVRSFISNLTSLFRIESSIILITLQDSAPPFGEATYPGVIAVIEQTYSRQSLSPNPIKLIILSIAESSIKQYNCAYSKWWQFFIKHRMNFFESNISTIIDFLCSAYVCIGAHYSTLNTYRSALAFIFIYYIILLAIYQANG